MVEIARAVLNDARVIIFDEPTAALTPEETEHLFELMKALRRRGVAMIFISHALEEALNHADRITVLRNGRLMVTGPASDFDRASLIRHMIGEELRKRAVSAARRVAPSAAPILQVENIRMGAMVNNMSFSVFPGEATGIAGLIGSGRSEVAKVIVGHTKRNFGGGRIWLNGRQVRYGAPAQAVADGIAYVSEDRKLDGFFETLGVSENIGLGWLAKFGRGRLLAPLRKMRSLAGDWEDRLSICRTGPDQPAVHLSGGNQQKVVIAKSLAQEPRLVIFDEPNSRGGRRRCHGDTQDHQGSRGLGGGSRGHLVLPARNPGCVRSHPGRQERDDRRGVSPIRSHCGEDPAGGDPLSPARGDHCLSLCAAPIFPGA